MKKGHQLILLLLTCFLWSTVAVAQGEKRSLLEGEIYSIDKTHSLMDFTARHIGFSRVRGTFKKYDAVVYYNEGNILKSTVSVWVEVVGRNEKT